MLCEAADSPTVWAEVVGLRLEVYELVLFSGDLRCGFEEAC